MTFKDMDQENLYSKIISEKNIEEAYYEVIRKFDKNLKSNRYSGFDGITLNDYNCNSKKIIEQVKKELEINNYNRPALKFEISKKGKPGKRNIFVYPVFERIKTQAIYQVFSPFLNKKLTRFLYSYRSSHPYEKALQQSIRRYYKNNKESILVGDISSYTENINHEILMQKVSDLKIDNKTINLISLFTNSQYLEKGEIKKSKIGVLAGSPMSVLFFNLYLNDMDKIIGKKYNFYRRVGDDFIIFDEKTKLHEVQKDIENYLDSVKITKNLHKIRILEKQEDFCFLGCRFRKGLVSIPSVSVKRIKGYIRKVFKYVRGTHINKIKKIKKIYYREPALIDIMLQNIKQYKFVNNDNQVKELSQYFFIRMTIFIFGKYSCRNHRKTLELTLNIEIPSFFNDYIMIKNGKIKISELKIRNQKLKRKYG
jgi:hypothetical protein